MTTNEAPKMNGLGTRALHAGQHPDPATGSGAMPIHQTTSDVVRNTPRAADLFALKEMGWIYTRLMNPTIDVLEQRMAALDDGTVTLLGQTFKRMGIKVAFVDMTDPQNIEKAIKPNTASALDWKMSKTFSPTANRPWPPARNRRFLPRIGSSWNDATR